MSNTASHPRARPANDGHRLGGRDPGDGSQRIAAEYARLVEHSPIHALDIPDEYKCMDPELIEILEQTVEPLLFA